MTSLVPATLITRATSGDRAALREVLEVQAAAVVADRLREQLWLRMGVVGVWGLIAVTGGEVANDLGYLDWPWLDSSGLIAISQLVTVLTFVAISTAYFLGRLRLVRSEMDLLRLKLEWLADDPSEDPDSGVAASMLKNTSVAKGRRVNLEPND